MEQIKMGEPNKVTESLHCFKTSTFNIYANFIQRRGHLLHIFRYL